MITNFIRVSWPLAILVAVLIFTTNQMRFAYYDGFYFRILQNGQVLHIEASPYAKYIGHVATFMHHRGSNSGSITFSFDRTYYYAMFEHFDGVLDIQFINDNLFGEWIFSARNVEARRVIFGHINRSNKSAIPSSYAVSTSYDNYCCEVSNLALHESQRNALLQSAMIVHLRALQQHTEIRVYILPILLLVFIGYSLYLNPVAFLQLVKKVLFLAFSLIHKIFNSPKEYLGLPDTFVIKVAGLTILTIMLALLFYLI